MTMITTPGGLAAHLCAEVAAGIARKAEDAEDWAKAVHYWRNAQMLYIECGCDLFASVAYAAADHARNMTVRQLEAVCQVIANPLIPSPDNCPTCGRRIGDYDVIGCELPNGQRWCLDHVRRHFGTEDLAAIMDTVGGQDDTDDEPSARADAVTVPPVDIRKGTVLANGATVLSARAVGSGRWIVLAETESGEFVTWEASSPANTYWGHYFRGLVEASRDFGTRSGGFTDSSDVQP